MGEWGVRRRVRRVGAGIAAAAALVGTAGCGETLPPGTAQFTVGRTVVRTDSTLDLVGVVWRLADTAHVPPRGPVRHWLGALQTQLDDTAFALARALGPTPVSLILETWASPDVPDTACGLLAPGAWRCFTGNEALKGGVRRFFAAARAFGPRTAPVALEGLNEEARRQDLADVYTALTRGRALDSAVISYSGYADLTFDVTLARTLSTLLTTAPVDPSTPRAPRYQIFLTPDAVFPLRSYRSPGYVWQALIHQMTHAAVRRLLAEHPEVAERSFHLRPAVEGEMVRSGYPAVFWDQALAEQLARAITLRILEAARPTVTWAARAEALNTNMALVPWLEDALQRYEARRDSFPTLSDFAPRLTAALDSIPVDSCKAAPNPGVALIGVARSRAVVAWIADSSIFRDRGLAVGDTVLTVDGDSVSAGGLLLPTRQLELNWLRHLPVELGILDIKRGRNEYQIRAPVSYVPRPIARVASQSRAAALAQGELPICRWVRRAVRQPARR